MVTPTVSAPALVLRGQPLNVTGTGRAGTAGHAARHQPGGRPGPGADARRQRRLVGHRARPRPNGGPYTLTATSGPQTSTPVTATMNGTTITGPATAARGGHIVLTGLAAPGRTVTVYVTRPDAKPYAIKTTARANGSYSVTAPVGAAAGWYAVSNSYRTPEGHSLLHGVTVAGPASGQRGKAGGHQRAGRAHGPRWSCSRTPTTASRPSDMPYGPTPAVPTGSRPRSPSARSGGQPRQAHAHRSTPP